MMRFLLLLAVELVLLACNAEVVLNTSAARVCPGGTVVFTCTTDTGQLFWESNGMNELYRSSKSQLYAHDVLDVFTVNLTGINGMTLVSTVTVQYVQLNHNGRVITCSDAAFQGSFISRTIQISDPPSSPNNLTIIDSTDLSWVAPLDTPLCVHSYTVTVRNSCNSSQVMVYNTTDNRSSLSITDLTSDGEYSVTVAGRDAAGRLGQESDKLDTSMDVVLRALKQITIEYDTIITIGHVYGMLFRWNYTVYDVKHVHNSFVITHNVSSDQSPITVNRTNVTLYGVQPGETYTVEITPYHLRTCFLPHSALSLTIAIKATDFPNNCQRSGINSTNQSETSGIPGWVFPSIVVPWVLLIILITCQLIYMVKTKVDKKQQKSKIFHLNNCQKKDNASPKVATTYYEKVGHAGKEFYNEE